MTTLDNINSSMTIMEAMSNQLVNVMRCYSYSVIFETGLTCGLPQQTPMHPMMEPAKVRMTAIALVITMAMTVDSMVLISLQLLTVEKKVL